MNSYKLTVVFKSNTKPEQINSFHFEHHVINAIRDGILDDRIEGSMKLEKLELFYDEGLFDFSSVRFVSDNNAENVKRIKVRPVKKKKYRAIRGVADCLCDIKCFDAGL